MAALPAEIRATLPWLLDSAAVHAQEHALEVHLPFLQALLEASMPSTSPWPLERADCAPWR